MRWARARPSIHTLHDAYLALDRPGEPSARLLVARVLVRRDRPLHALELDHDCALVGAALERPCGDPARQDAAAARHEQRRRISPCRKS